MDIAKYIDHTLLKPYSTNLQINKLCQEANEYHFASVCVNPSWVSYCVPRLTRKSTNICSVVGFPFGLSLPNVKALEAKRVVACGASEIDMVINIGDLKSGYLTLVENDIQVVRDAVPQHTVLKVIIETCLLTREEKILACKIAKEAGADFVKTSTGFSTGGATVEDVALMRKTVGKKIGVKAAGGIRDFATAKAMLDAGANRLGCSASVAIVKEALSKT